MTTPKRPRDPNQLAKKIVDLETMDEAERDAAVRAAEKKQSKPSPKRP
jgi:hypothetical protein